MTSCRVRESHEVQEIVVYFTHPTLNRQAVSSVGSPERKFSDFNIFPLANHYQPMSVAAECTVSCALCGVSSRVGWTQESKKGELPGLPKK